MSVRRLSGDAERQGRAENGRTAIFKPPKPVMWKGRENSSVRLPRDGKADEGVEVKVRKTLI